MNSIKNENFSHNRHLYLIENFDVFIGILIKHICVLCSCLHKKIIAIIFIAKKIYDCFCR